MCRVLTTSGFLSSLKEESGEGFLIRHRQRPIKMAEVHVFCYPASSAPAADDCKWESGQSGEVTELSAAKSLFIDFSEFELGWARGSRWWPCAV